MATKDEIERDKELYNKRLRLYESLWKILELLPRYAGPKRIKTSKLKQLNEDMRNWYFDQSGGMYLSDEVRPFYFALKERLEDLTKSDENQMDELPDPKRKPLIDSASLLRKRLRKDVDTSRSIFSRIAVAKTNNIQQVSALQLELSDGYYKSVLGQANKSFWSALVAAGIGLAFFIAAGFFVFVKNKDVSIITGLSGVLIEIVSGLNFYLFGKTQNKLDIFHIRLEQTQRFLLANSICSQLEKKEQQKSRAGLVQKIADLSIAANFMAALRQEESLSSKKDGKSQSSPSTTGNNSSVVEGSNTSN